jgi:hypothetical protein
VPVLGLSGVRVLTGIDESREAQVGVFRPIGRERAVVIDGGLGGWDGSYRIVVKTDAEWQDLEALLASRTTVLVQDPFGYQKHVRFVSRSVTLEGTPTAPFRVATVGYVEVDG